MIYRDAGPWGAGKGSNLTAVEADENFHELDAELAGFVPILPAGVADVTVQAGDVLAVTQTITFALDNGNVFGRWSFL